MCFRQFGPNLGMTRLGSNSDPTLIRRGSNSHPTRIPTHIQRGTNSHPTRIQLTSNADPTHIQLPSNRQKLMGMTFLKTHIKRTFNWHQTHIYNGEDDVRLMLVGCAFDANRRRGWGGCLGIKLPQTHIELGPAHIQLTSKRASNAHRHPHYKCALVWAFPISY